jgi:glycolate oxidase iron-sulfur subunit
MQDSCHLRHAQGLPLSSALSLRRIPGLTVIEPAEQDICCGSAGIYNLVEPEPAQALGDRKVAHIDAVEPDVVATANPGCTLQMAAAARRRGRPLTIRHPIELVDASIRGSRNV